MKVLAPGKIILSGEHAVVYGKPAIAMAVNRYTTASIAQQFLPFISLDLSDLSYQDRLSFSALHHLKKRIKEKYQRFLRGEFTIRDVLQRPVELAQFALTLFFEMVNIKITQGMKIHVSSDIPMGCGMGSSAATVLSIVHAIACYLGLPLSKETLFRLGLEAENMQHGFSSGLDLRISMQGGCLYVNDGILQERSIPTFPMYLVNTGTPETHTGECVEHVAPFFKSSQMGNDFASITNAMDGALQQNQFSSLIEAVRANHHLLNRIEVVPERVQFFIEAIEKIGGAAKVCGAGSILGDAAGMVWVVIENEIALKDLCLQHHYTLLPIQGEPRGVHVI